ncbi:LT_GEWL domain containing protein [uncultured Caudovirales phage]|uniref:LT_GEWL domain containing protein n=1 Tax=uncultured Caudovirales phage TaxID=2100421 RepID=A0A6J5Q1F7_9CAUD|nr:LT_GEWL domain containing protein [uncultured Caudovirales phage]CAB4179921.1 LT_GEWL domain containing protein [uncultured Caudovirales phage]CAB4188764.1 LT_GEWL domain containing protein [uncultured Caudovirales phage]
MRSSVRVCTPKYTQLLLDLYVYIGVNYLISVGLDAGCNSCDMVEADRGSSNGAFCQLRGAEMLNIRINLTVNLKKVVATVLAGMLMTTHLITPAHALNVKPDVTHEKVIVASLTHLKVVTTKSEAKAALASDSVKYFDAEALAFLTVYVKGWKMSEWTCLRNLWTKESHFNPKALNKSSGAYGIAQFMPSTWGNYKVTKTAEAKLQIKYGLRYIDRRYGSACNAWNFWTNNNWY